MFVDGFRPKNPGFGHPFTGNQKIHKAYYYSLLFLFLLSSHRRIFDVSIVFETHSMKFKKSLQLCGGAATSTYVILAYIKTYLYKHPLGNFSKLFCKIVLKRCIIFLNTLKGYNANIFPSLRNVQYYDFFYQIPRTFFSLM